jgi:hypothetical protein
MSVTVINADIKKLSDYISEFVFIICCQIKSTMQNLGFKTQSFLLTVLAQH